MGVHSEKGLAELDRLGVLHADLADHALHLGLDLVHDLHRFDDAHHLAGRHPGAEPYVKGGSRVAPRQVVCIIEAMKIMNEIESEVAGVIREVLVENSQPVEFGQPLFRVDPHA